MSETFPQSDDKPTPQTGHHRLERVDGPTVDGSTLPKDITSPVIFSGSTGEQPEPENGDTPGSEI